MKTDEGPGDHAQEQKRRKNPKANEVMTAVFVLDYDRELSCLYAIGRLEKRPGAMR